MPFERLEDELEKRDVRHQDDITSKLEHMEERDHDTDKLVDFIQDMPEGLEGFDLYKILNRNLNVDYYNSKLMLSHLASISDSELSEHEETIDRLKSKHHEDRNEAMKDIFWEKHESELKQLGFEDKEQMKSWNTKYLFKLLEFDPNKYKVKGSEEKDLKAFSLAVKNSDNFRDYFEDLPGTQEVLDDLESMDVDTSVWDNPEKKYEYTLHEDDERKHVLELEMWDRDPKKDLFIAEGSGDCSSITAPQFWNRTPQIMDKAISVFRINKKTVNKKKDKERKRQVGQLYTIATKDRENNPILSVEAIEVSESLRPDDKAAEGIEDAIHKYAEESNFDRITLDSAVSARDWIKDHFVEKHGEENTQLVELEKAGGFNGGNKDRLNLNDLYYQMFAWHSKPEGHVLSNSWVTDLEGNQVETPEISAEKKRGGAGRSMPPPGGPRGLEGEKKELFRSIMHGMDEGFREALEESPLRDAESLSQVPPPRTVDALDREHRKMVRGIVKEVLSGFDEGEIDRDEISGEVKKRLRDSAIDFNEQVDENPPPETPDEIEPYIEEKQPDPRSVGMKAVKSAIEEHYD